MLIRRNPLVVLLCLELMLNAGNLALIGFARSWGNGDGQIFAIVVMVIAACEVAIGLGIVVALYRRRLPIDVDELRELHGESPERRGEPPDRRLARARDAARRHDRDRAAQPQRPARPRRRLGRDGGDRRWRSSSR